MARCSRAMAAFSLLFAGCASQTRLISQRDTTIYDVENNQPLGMGELSYSDTKPVWGSTRFRFEKQGCKTQELTISRSDDISALRLVGGFFTATLLWWWSGDYNASYTVPLTCDSAPAGVARPQQPQQQQQQQQQQQTTVVVPIVQGPQAPSSAGGCTKDTDCKGNRICSRRGECVEP
jgi:hypothetical protein